MTTPQNEDSVLLVSYKDLPGGVKVEVWTVNRPKALNALAVSVIEALEKELTRLENLLSKDLTACRVLVLKGAGEKAFVAGADIVAMSAMGQAEAEAYSRRTQKVFSRIERLPIPTVAAVTGFALGGGCELAMSCDVIAASHTAEFGQPEAHLGLIPGFGGHARFVSRLGAGKALELLYSGLRIKVEEAKALGLVQRIADAGEDIESFALKLAAEFTAKSGPLAIARMKEVVRGCARVQTEKILDLEAKEFGRIFTSADAKEGIAAFLEKRPARFGGK